MGNYGPAVVFPFLLSPDAFVFAGLGAFALAGTGRKGKDPPASGGDCGPSFMWRGRPGGFYQSVVYLTNEEFVQDIVSILDVFSSRLYGLRKYKSKIKQDEEIAKELQGQNSSDS